MSLCCNINDFFSDQMIDGFIVTTDIHIWLHIDAKINTINHTLTIFTDTPQSNTTQTLRTMKPWIFVFSQLTPWLLAWSIQTMFSSQDLHLELRAHKSVSPDAPLGYLSLRSGSAFWEEAGGKESRQFAGMLWEDAQLLKHQMLLETSSETSFWPYLFVSRSDFWTSVYWFSKLVDSNPEPSKSPWQESHIGTDCFCTSHQLFQSQSPLHLLRIIWINIVEKKMLLAQSPSCSFYVDINENCLCPAQSIRGLQMSEHNCSVFLSQD